MRPTTIRQKTGHDLFNKLLKPSCMDCLYFCREPTSLHNPEQIISSTCKKLIDTPKITNFTDRGAVFSYSIKQPYALLARFDNKMCGLDGNSFTPKK
jgi:hypothetical protein